MTIAKPSTSLSLAGDLQTAKPWLTGKVYEVAVKDEHGNEVGRVAVDLPNRTVKRRSAFGVTWMNTSDRLGSHST